MKNLWLFDEQRLKILKQLLACHDEMRGCDIKRCVAMQKTLLSYHLRLLLDKGIVLERKEGREKYYCIAPKKRTFIKSVLKLVN